MRLTSRYWGKGCLLLSHKSNFPASNDTKVTGPVIVATVNSVTEMVVLPAGAFRGNGIADVMPSTSAVMANVI
jgi:hypothetical protein